MLNNTAMTCKLTVAICTYNRSAILKQCIEALVQQKYFNDIKLIIVDNNSTDNTFNIVNLFINIYSNIRYIKEIKQGLSHSRNRAVTECFTEWIAFIDDDAIARDDWIKCIINTIEKKILMRLVVHTMLYTNMD